MKKINKILAAISTAALTFCVWGTQTQAKVVTNENGVPTHIEADNKEEFFSDLQQVLNHIESRLVVEGYEPQKIHELFLEENELTKATENSISFSEYAYKQYNYALTPIKIHIGIAEGYLYSLLLKSKINNLEIKNVYQLRFEGPRFVYGRGTGEIIFSLPAPETVYYTPSLRWHVWPDSVEKTKLHPKLTTFRESIENPVEFKNPHARTDVWIKETQSLPTTHPIITCFVYSQAELLGHADTIIPKLISIAGIRIEDEKLGLAFRNHSNLITDYDEFVKKYNETKN